MTRIQSLVSLSFLLLLILSNSAQADSSSIYEILKARGLPVHLDQACNAKYESEIHYDRNVSGTISYGRIESLSGISAQELFLWFPVKGIRVDVPSSGLIYFDVGVVLKQFSLSLFETPRDCAASSDKKIEEVENGRIVIDGFLKVFFLLVLALFLIDWFRIVNSFSTLFGMCRMRKRS
ncbi:hypothetical protein LINPERPRIM_LOCUS39535 [Linum perenne]